MILFGGKKQGDQRYCNDKCLQRAQLVQTAGEMPVHLVQQQVQLVHRGECPQCKGQGPIDVHTSHRVWSAVFMTSWVSRPHVCCRSCGVRAQLLDAGFCLLLGWWGFPWGLVLTPVQIARNVAGALKHDDPYKPSPELELMVRQQMAAQALAARKQRAA